MNCSTVKLLRNTGIVAIAFAWMTASAHCAELVAPKYHFEPTTVLSTLDDQQIALLEKLNRADRAHLHRVGQLVAPDQWTSDELWYSPLPTTVQGFEPHAKLLIVSLPDQVFGAYEDGLLVQWGPVCSGRAALPTPQGLYFLNWRSRERVSTDNPAWRMRWYFNFDNRRGLAFHEYALPGTPASHACIRLLSRDARWLFGWGEGWNLSANGQEVLRRGTPVLILGSYAYAAVRPWRNPGSWDKTIAVSRASDLSILSGDN
jgi:lipoprotein-anchoring transpeptidase ErfK/SrfK